MTTNNILLNCTPHEIKVFDLLGNVLATIPKSEYVVRLAQELNGRPDKCKFYSSYGSIPVTNPPKYLNVQGLPPKNDDCSYDIIVSSIVANELSCGNLPEHINRVYSPDSGPNGVVRDNDGNIIGTKALICWYGD